MSCVPYVRYGLVCVGNCASALLRICRTKSKVRFVYQICDGCPSHVSSCHAASKQSSLLLRCTLQTKTLAAKPSQIKKLLQLLVRLQLLNSTSPFCCAPGRLVVRRLQRSLATLATLNSLAAFSKHFLFRCVPGRLAIAKL